MSNEESKREPATVAKDTQPAIEIERSTGSHKRITILASVVVAAVLISTLAYSGKSADAETGITKSCGIRSTSRRALNLRISNSQRRRSIGDAVVAWVNPAIKTVESEARFVEDLRRKNVGPTQTGDLAGNVAEFAVGNSIRSLNTSRTCAGRR